MAREFPQITWSKELDATVANLARLALHEDLGGEGDITTDALVPADATGMATVVVRKPGVLAGIRTIDAILDVFQANLRWEPWTEDGSPVQGGHAVGTFAGSVRDLLAAERILLNFLCRLSGIASLTKQYVEAVRGTQARIYDTRKTTPAWRHLEKYAVRCGGGFNHRLGLNAAVLIKDNHLAWIAQELGCDANRAAKVAVRRARERLKEKSASAAHRADRPIIEVEVDHLSQLQEVLPEKPDLVLLDNMSCEELKAAVELRDKLAPEVELEASGGVNLQTVQTIAQAGVDRISVGALTHAASWLDIGLDWAA